MTTLVILADNVPYLLIFTFYGCLALFSFATACYIGSGKSYVNVQISDPRFNPVAPLQITPSGLRELQTVSVNSLPTELLILVFEAVLVPSDAAQISLLDLSHVCHRWRCVILTSSSLWSHALDVTHPSTLFAEELRRSKPMQLDVCIDLPRLSQQRHARTIVNLAMATRHFSRIRTFSVSGAPGEIMSLINSGFWLSANLLETFTLCNTFAPSSMDNVPILPHVFMGLYAPRLQTLHLAGCALDWENLRFSSLRHLYVHHLPLWAKPSQEQLISALRLVPRLETLSLHNVLSIAEETTSSLAATLSRLQSINLLGSIGICTKLLLSLDLPSLQSITGLLECPDGTAPGQAHLFYQALSSTCCRMRPTSVVVCSVGDELEVRAADELLQQECFALRLVWPSPLPGQDVLSTLVDLCRVFPSAQIRTLHFDIYAKCFSRSVFWVELFECFPMVANLYLRNYDDTTDEVLNELIINSLGASDVAAIGQPLPVLLPELKKLYIHWISLSLCEQAQQFAELREAIGRPMEVWPRDMDSSTAISLV